MALSTRSLREDVMKQKNIIKSKTFWVNLLSIAAAVTGIIPIDPETAAIIVGCVNIALRAITKDPVTVL